MIPIKLTIQGFNSYIERQEIDFTQLNKAKVFGIFGAVGSGKSSILEAMMLCIYGNTERFNLKGDDRNYNMMNLKSKSIHLGFTFLAGNDDQIYHIDLQYTRNGQRFEDVGLTNHLFYLMDKDGGRIPVTKEEVIQAVGLSYQNFKRTVIIPQGQFREFLELSPTDRSKMLKGLFNLERFSLYKKWSVVDSKNEAELLTLNGQLSTLAHVDDTVISDTKEALLQNEKQLADLEVIHQRQQTSLQELEKLRDDLVQLQLLEKELADLLASRSADEQLLNEIKEYEFIREHFRDLFNQQYQLNDQYQKAAVSLAGEEKRLAEIRPSLDALRKEITVLEAALQIAIENKSKADDLDRLIRLSEVKEQHRAHLDQLLTIQQQNQKNQQQIDHYRLEIEKAKVLVNSISAQLMLVDKRVIIAEWFSNLENMQQVMREKSSEKDKLTLSLSQSEYAFKKLYAEQPAEWKLNFDPSISLDQCKAQISILRDSMENKINDDRQLLTRFAITIQLQEHAAGLKDGEPCLLCGSLHHPHPLHEEDVSGKWSIVHARIEASEQSAKALDTFKESCISLFNDRDKLILRLADVETDINEKSLVLNQLLEKQPDKQFGPDQRSAFDEAGRQSDTQQKKLISINQQIEEWEKNLSGAQLAMEQGITKERNAEIAVAQFNNSIQHIIEQMVVVDPITYEGVQVEEMVKERDQIRLSAEQSLQKLEENNNLLQAVDKQYAVMQDRISHAQALIKQLDADKQAIDTKIDALLLTHNQTHAAVLQILSKKLDTVDLRDQITARNSIFLSKQTACQIIQERIGNRSFDIVELERIRSEFNASAIFLDQLKAQRGMLQNQIEEMTKSNALRKKLEERKKSVETRKNNLNVLKKLFVGESFVDFISRRYLLNVIAHANVRFRRMVRQKYALELSSKNEFMIRDYMNGGKPRHIKSLSGGQTFQAALCLAMALSESIQRNAGVSQQFFFIDEGFGSQDAENLQNVFDILREDDGGRRIIGLISHVNDLQQELDIYLRVELGEDKGTRIYPSWT